MSSGPKSNAANKPGAMKWILSVIITLAGLAFLIWYFSKSGKPAEIPATADTTVVAKTNTKIPVSTAPSITTPELI